MLLWWSCQSPVAHEVAFWIIQIVSMEECSSLKQNSMQIHCSTYSVILNTSATQCTCSLNGIYLLHWLVQWSHYCSHMYIPVHSPWLTGYIDVVQAVLLVLTMTELFPGRPHHTQLQVDYSGGFEPFCVFHFTRILWTELLIQNMLSIFSDIKSKRKTQEKKLTSGSSLLNIQKE